jgi:hypothetical protein
MNFLVSIGIAEMERTPAGHEVPALVARFVLSLNPRQALGLRCRYQQELAPLKGGGPTLGYIVGINEDGVFGTSRERWHVDLPDACHERFIPLLWLKVHELLGRVPAGSTARFIQDGTLPGEAQGGATAFRMAC